MNKSCILLDYIDGNEYGHGDFGANLALIHNHLARISTELDYRYPYTAKNHIRAILVAPEYFFSCGGSPSQSNSRQYTQEEAREIQKRLAYYSAIFPGILIISGTIASKKHALKGGQVESYSMLAPNQIPAAKKLSEVEYHKQKNQRGIISDANDYQNYLMKPGDSAILKSREQLTNQSVYANHGRANPKMPSNHPKDKAKSLADGRYLLSKTPVSNFDTLELSKNTAYVYLSGQRIFKYHKRSDFQEVVDQGNNTYIPGSAPPIFKVDGITFGLEVCLDHCCNVLGKFIQRNRGLNSLNSSIEHFKENVDIHVILSDVVKNNPNFYCAKPSGGYIIHSSTSQDSQCLLALGKPQFQLISISRNVKCVPFQPRLFSAPQAQDRPRDHFFQPRLDPRPEPSAPKKRSGSFGF